MRLTREVKTGILAIGAILLFIFGYSFLKGTNLLEKNRTFYVKYDNVEGLSKAAPVTINGLVVGKIQRIDFRNNEGGLLVSFTVERDFDFSKASVVNIYSTGLIGGKALAIIPKYQGEIAKSGDTLSGTSEDGMLTAVSKALGPLEKKVNNTLAVVDTLLISVNDILDPATRDNLKSAIANLDGTMGSLKGASRSLDVLLNENSDKLDRTFTNLDGMAANFKSLSDSLAQLEAGRLVNDLQNVVSKFDALIVGIDNGEGTVGKLLKDDQIYANLEGATRQLEQLIQDVKLNPKRYVNISVFAKKDKGYKEPEDPDQ
ncbi:MAG: MCE family protein [Flavobacteriaceae bacterium]|nr:MCE family protein [Flavobacteriaceae bacterium]